MPVLTFRISAVAAPRGRELGLDRFLAEEQGGMTIYLLLMAVLMTGLLGLVVDSSRSFVAHSNMQNYVDDLALAVANELDGEADALARAMVVINSSPLSKSTTIRTDGSGAFSLGSVHFLSGPPATGTSTLTAADYQHLETTDPTQATHVLLTTMPEDVPWSALNILDPFLRSDNNPGAYTVRTWAAATLVRDQACATPLFTACLPAGADPATFQPGSQIQLTKNRDGNWSAGEYGLVTGVPDDAAGTCSSFTGNQLLECLLALDTHQTECGPADVSFQGDRTVATTVTAADGTNLIVRNDSLDVHAPMNIRFGIFDPSTSAYASSDQVSIDRNHITGVPYACTGDVVDISSETQSLPMHPCFSDGSCDFMSAPVTQTELDRYWEKAHGGSLPSTDFEGQPFETRYDVYRHEVATGLVDPEGTGTQGPRAICHPTQGGTDTKANRRLFEIAFVDCSNMTNVDQADVPVEAYADVFLTNPVEMTEYFVATFDHLIDRTPNDGVDNPQAMLPGQAVTGKVGYDPYAAQGMSVHTLAIASNGNPTLDYTPCAVGDFCAVFPNASGSRLDRNSANEDALDFLDALGLGGFSQVGHDRKTGINSGFDAGAIGQSSGTWHSSNARQLLVWEGNGGIAVSVYENARAGGDWSMEGLGLGGGTLERVRAFSFTGSVPDSIITTGSHRGYNYPMLFDTQEGWAEDPDLQSVDRGNVVIIPEHPRPDRPDDHARGGMILFQFDEPSSIGSVVFFDGEEAHNTIKLYNEKIVLEGVGAMTHPDQLDDLYTPDLVLSVPVIGDGLHRTFRIDSHPDYLAAVAAGTISSDGIQTMIYHMTGSGAIDDISFTNTTATQNRHDDMTVELLNVMDANDPRISQYPVITN